MMDLLIRNVVEFKEVIGGVQKSITFETIKGFIKTAELRYIIPMIGEVFYDELVAYSGNDAQVIGLKSRLKIASGFYALSIGAPQLIMSFGDSGISTAQTGTQPIGKWSYVELRDSSLSQADSAMEDAIQYLEKHEKKQVDDIYVFKTWRDSPEFSISNELFINSATQLTDYFPPAKNARRVFLGMREYIKRAENYFIRPLLGDVFFSYLKSKSLDDDYEWTVEEKELLEHLRNALSHKAFSMGIPYLNLSADFRLITETDGVRNENPATVGKLDGMKVDCDNNATIFGNKLKKYIDSVASSTKLVAYFNSSTYASSVMNKSYIRTPIDSSQGFVSI